MEYRIFGCKTNKYFTDRWMSDAEFSARPGIFVASCVVTENAKRKWRKFVKKAATSLPAGGKIYLSGCWALVNGQVSDAFFETYPELLEFRDVIDLLPEDPEDLNSDDSGDTGKNPTWKSPLAKDSGALEKIRRLSSARWAGIFTRQYSVVQTGCDNLCSFCLTVAARGRHRSRPESDIIEEIRAFAERGGNEAVITGTNVGAWGAENTNRFEEGKLPELIWKILSETKIGRIRVSSLGPEFVSDAFLSLLKNPRVHAYVHLSVQSGSSPILKKMGRKYDAEVLREKLKNLRSIVRDDGVTINIGADVIVGFPGETSEDFANTLSVMKDFKVSQIHAFPFSPHEGLHSVPAAKLANQIDEKTKSARMAVLSAVGIENKREFLMANDGKTFELLPEGSPKSDKFNGWSENHIELDETNFEPFPGQTFERGKIVSWIYRYLPGSESKEILSEKTD